MSVVGIDPGNAGAIVAISKRFTDVWDMPTLVTEGKGKTKKGNIKKHTVLDEHKVREIFLELMDKEDIENVFIEKAQSMPGQGAPATFNYAASYGILRGVCVGLQIPYTLVRPASWRNSLLKDMDKGKNSSLVRAKQLFPMADIGKKDGRAEALLIAFYGKKELL